jgi:ADP-ribose pyrophosphatase
MTLPLFVFGTLRDAGLRAAVAGAELPGSRAVLPGHVVARALDGMGVPQPFPVLASRPGGQAEGLILHPSPAQQARLDAYEALFHYDLAPVTVLQEGRQVAARVYLPQSETWVPGPDWDLDSWAQDWAWVRTRAASDILSLWPDLPMTTLRNRYPMIEAAAASARRALAEPAPATLRRRPATDDVDSAAARNPYAQFFGVKEEDLRFRRFDGGMSQQVTRAGFVMADAVTVLPYDPVADRVLLIEQFRYGPWLRGDPNPWSLEPIAGRIEPGENPEQAARREAAEESGLVLGALVPVGRYYPTPGAVTEYLVSYVGLIELGPEHEGIGGVASEAEDIRSHVIPFDRLMMLVASGEVENGPLLLSALWLSAHRVQLRGGT